MKDEKTLDTEKVYKAPLGSTGTMRVSKVTQAIEYHAGWTILRKREVPFAEMFSVSYLVKDSKKQRPITFVLNGGPGASSAFLHIGALGPQRAVFTKDGQVASTTAALVDNQETWLQFTDLVFIDPIGTGLSRTVDDVRFEKALPKDETEEKLVPRGENNKEYWAIKRDLDAIGEFVQRFLSEHNRWLSPVYIAGESYGGYRVAKLARSLQENYGVGLAGVSIISPCFELTNLDGSDYEPTSWLEAFPSFALAAAYHGKSRALKKGLPSEESIRKLEQFALQDLSRFFIAGEYLPAVERKKINETYADFVGLDSSYISRKNSHVSIVEFAQNLLQDKSRALGLYDASVTAQNPFPGRDQWIGPDPTFSGIDHVFTSGINHHIRTNLKLKSDRRYHLLSEEAFLNWKNDLATHVFNLRVGAMDDLRYAIALAPGMQVWVTHGYFDLVTPFFASRRLSYLAQLDPEQKRQLSQSNYLGGHMFYTWEQSRKEFFRDASRMYTKQRVG